MANPKPKPAPGGNFGDRHQRMTNTMTGQKYAANRVGRVQVEANPRMPGGREVTQAPAGNFGRYRPPKPTAKPKPHK